MFHRSFGKPAARIDHSLWGCFSSYLILTGYTCVSTVLMRAQFNCYQVVLLNPAHHVSARPLWSLLLSHFPAHKASAHEGLCGLFPPQMQSSALALAELREVSVSPPLQLTGGPLKGGHAPQCTHCSSQLDGVCTLAEGAHCLLFTLLTKTMNEINPGGDVWGCCL